MRGKIRNAAQAQTLRDFSGLRWGSITPTDIDGFVEFGNEVFIFIEGKYKGAKLHYGQKLALERLVDAMTDSRKALLIVCAHECEPHEEIDYADCIVTAYRSSRMWHIPPASMTVRRLIDKFRRHCGL